VYSNLIAQIFNSNSLDINMASRKLDHIRSLKVNLDKVLNSPYAENEGERISDILKSLYKIEMDSLLLRQSEIGSTIKEIKKIFGDSPIGAMVKKLVSKWKKDCEQVPPSAPATSPQQQVKTTSSSIKKSTPIVEERKQSPVQPSSSSSNKTTNPSLSLIRLPSGDEDDDEENYWNDEELYTPLSDRRKSVSFISNYT